MKKFVLFSILMLCLVISISYAYTDQGTYFECSTDCTSALANNSLLEVRATGNTGSGIPVSATTNWINKTLDCQGNGFNSKLTLGSGIDNFTIKNCIFTSVGGIEPTSVNNITIYNNTFAAFTASGVKLTTTNSSNITTNNFTSNDEGIQLINSRNNIVSDNIVVGSQYGSISGTSASNTTFYNNTVNNYIGRAEGIRLDGGVNNTVYGNNLIGSSWSLLLYYSDNNTIYDNNLTGSKLGISMRTGSDNNTIYDNIIGNITNFAIEIKDSKYSTFTGNVITATSGAYGIFFGEIFRTTSTDEEYYNHTFSTTNTINGKLVYYYHDQTSVTLSPTDPAFIGCYNCSDVTISDVEITEAGSGIILANTNNSNITDVTLGSNYAAIIIANQSYNNTVGSSVLYSNTYRTLIDWGNTTLFLGDNVLFNSVTAPVSNRWYDTNYTYFSFNISNLTYNNASCSLYVDSSVVGTNTSVYPEQITNFTYDVTTEGTHTYYFNCTDINVTDIFSFKTSTTTFGIKWSDNNACTEDTQCSSGYCVHSVCRATDPYCGDNVCDAYESGSCVADCGAQQSAAQGGLVSEDFSVSEPLEEIAQEELPQTLSFSAPVLNFERGVLTVPAEGAALALTLDGQEVVSDTGYPVSFVLFNQAGEVNVLKTEEISPEDFKEPACYQQDIVSYVIEIEGEEKYLCLDTAAYDVPENVEDVKTYKFENGEWNEILYKQYEGKLCARITSTPYMIAGFKTSASQEQALLTMGEAEEELQKAVEQGIDTTSSKETLTQAQIAYSNCQYASATELAQSAKEAVSLINIPVEIVAAGIIVLLAGAGFYWNLKRKVKIKKKVKK